MPLYSTLNPHSCHYYVDIYNYITYVYNHTVTISKVYMQVIDVGNITVKIQDQFRIIKKQNCKRPFMHLPLKSYGTLINLNLCKYLFNSEIKYFREAQSSAFIQVIRMQLVQAFTWNLPAENKVLVHSLKELQLICSITTKTGQNIYLTLWKVCQLLGICQIKHCLTYCLIKLDYKLQNYKKANPWLWIIEYWKFWESTTLSG